MIPVKLIPAFKDYIWGGTRLRTEFHKQTDLNPVAESWEVSCHPDGLTRIATGPAAGVALADFIQQNNPVSVLGTACEKFRDFPILIKFIDALDNLSVQVHPDDAYARATEDPDANGKTEMWHIVDCEPGASILYGFQKEISKEELRARIEDNTLLDVLQRVPVKKGDTFFIQAGTIHAIGKGIMVAEIQQNSNFTYRVYDYGRVGADGKPRELHVDKAVDVIQRRPAPPLKVEPPVTGTGYSMQKLVDCDYFHTSLLDVASGHAPQFSVDPVSFACLQVLDGNGALISQENAISISKGDSVFLPADTGSYIVQGPCRALLTTIA